MNGPKVHTANELLRIMLHACNARPRFPLWTVGTGGPRSVEIRDSYALATAIEQTLKAPDQTDALVEAAMCAWEAVLDMLERPATPGSPNRWCGFQERNGMAALRDHVQQFVPTIEADYRACAELGYDDAFDWEFVPDWLLLCLDDGLNVKHGMDRVDTIMGLKITREGAQS